MPDLQKMRVPVDGQPHQFTFSGDFLPRRPNGDVPGVKAGIGAVRFEIEPNGDPRERTFQVCQTSEPAPANAKLIETVLAPVDVLRWWHLFELVED